MHDHHEEALANTIQSASADCTCVACILVGCVPRGWARPESDIDVVYVVTDEEFSRRRKAAELQFYHHIKTAGTTVDVDGKIADRAFLEAVADGGIEPARAAFVDAELCYTEDHDLAAVLERIPVYPEDKRRERIRTFYSQMRAYRWYLGEAESRDDPYLRHHTASQLALFGGRLLLAHNRELFPYHKWFTRVLAEVPEKPPETMSLLNRLLRERTHTSAESFAGTIESFSDWDVPEAGWPVRFLLDREWQWRRGQPALEEL